MITQIEKLKNEIDSIVISTHFYQDCWGLDRDVIFLEKVKETITASCIKYLGESIITGYFPIKITTKWGDIFSSDNTIKWAYKGQIYTLINTTIPTADDKNTELKFYETDSFKLLQKKYPGLKTVDMPSAIIWGKSYFANTYKRSIEDLCKTYLDNQVYQELYIYQINPDNIRAIVVPYGARDAFMSKITNKPIDRKKFPVVEIVNPETKVTTTRIDIQVKDAQKFRRLLLKKL